MTEFVGKFLNKIDKKGRIRGVYNGTLGVETNRLMKHIEILKLEES